MIGPNHIFNLNLFLTIKENSKLLLNIKKLLKEKAFIRNKVKDTLWKAKF